MTYNHFCQCIEGNGRRVREVELDYKNFPQKEKLRLPGQIFD